MTKNNPEARSDFVLAVHEDKCLIFGGSTNLRRLNDFHELNLSKIYVFLKNFELETNLWKKINFENCPSPRFGHTGYKKINYY